ncbi:MAG: 5'/3'-nucleotidase SurE [Candidatus Coatesbacteria bacterium]|nr:5'/3'-nucleotidase SurE [Candidatus Coatesbacteria bacterium]
MNILLVNDDGIEAEGLVRLEHCLSDFCEVYVVAPEGERSACSHSITLRRPVRATRISERKFAVDGMPADCVNLALLNLFAGVQFDLVLSGINNGYNTGEDVSYSGTVAGAIEATALGRRAVALSVGYSERPRLDAACEFTRGFVRRFPMSELPPICFLNVNFPPGEGPFPVMVTKQGRLHFENSVTEVDNPGASGGASHGTRGFVIGRTTQYERAAKGTDVYAVNNGFISVTPMHVDLTDTRALQVTKRLVSAALAMDEAAESSLKSGLEARQQDA